MMTAIRVGKGSAFPAAAASPTAFGLIQSSGKAVIRVIGACHFVDWNRLTNWD
jgi:hypothetical protein